MTARCVVVYDMAQVGSLGHAQTKRLFGHNIPYIPVPARRIHCAARREAHRAERILPKWRQRLDCPMRRSTIWPKSGVWAMPKQNACLDTIYHTSQYQPEESIALRGGRLIEPREFFRSGGNGLTARCVVVRYGPSREFGPCPNKTLVWTQYTIHPSTSQKNPLPRCGERPFGPTGFFSCVQR